MSQNVIFKTMNYSLISSVNLLVYGLSSTLVTPSSLIIGLPMLLSICCEEQFVGVCLSYIGMIFHLINKYYLFLYTIYSLSL